MSLSIGLIGMPNVGKSTLLNALTRAGAEASNYPFCTIDRNIGTTVVPDPLLARLEAALHPESTIPAHILFVDIAGLVEGAHRGEGLGNKFLAHVREADALVHVVRVFHDESVSHVLGEPDPVRDVGVVNTELLLADLEQAERGAAAVARRLKAEPANKDAHAEAAAYERARTHLERGDSLRDAAAGDEAFAVWARRAQFLTAKPAVFVANVAEDDLRGEADPVVALRRHAAPAEVIPISAKIEAELQELPESERAGFLRDLDLEEPGLDRLVRVGQRLLDLITFYTIAHNKLQSWLIPRGARAPEAAGRIHGDMERGFIRAEVMHARDLLEHGSRARLHELGLLRTEGKGYVVQDGDVLTILFHT
jgi:GTP-binding protein YchF